MNLPKYRRQVAVDPDSERHPGDSSNRGTDSACVPDRYKQRSQDAEEPNSKQAGAVRDRLEHAALGIDVARLHKQHGCDRAKNVDDRYKHSRGEDGARKGPFWIAHLI